MIITKENNIHGLEECECCGKVLKSYDEYYYNWDNGDIYCIKCYEFYGEDIYNKSLKEKK